MSEVEDRRYEELLRKETVLSQSSANWHQWLGYPLVALLAAQLIYIGYRFTTEILDPYRLANALAIRLNEGAPSLIDAVESELAAEALSVALRAHGHVLSLVQLVGTASRNSLDQLNEMAPRLDAESKAVMDQYFEAHRDEARRAVAEQVGDEFVAGFVEALFRDVREQLARNAVAQVGGNEIGGPRNISVAYFKQLKETLDRLEGSFALEMSPRQRVRRRLIVAWTNLVRECMGLHTFSDLAAGSSRGS